MWRFRLPREICEIKRTETLRVLQYRKLRWRKICIKSIPWFPVVLAPCPLTEYKYNNTAFEYEQIGDSSDGHIFFDEGQKI